VISGLAYFASGEASVAVDGKLIGQVPLHSIIGELTIMAEEPATATVWLTSESRYFYLKVEDIRQLASRNAAIKTALLSSFLVDSKEKTMLRNREYLDATKVSNQA
jgi:CRP-like cAMP-binding protein